MSGTPDKPRQFPPTFREHVDQWGWDDSPIKDVPMRLAQSYLQGYRDKGVLCPCCGARIEGEEGK